MTDSWQWGLEVAFGCLSLLLIIIYHAVYLVLTYFSPKLTMLGQNLKAREMWIMQGFKKPDVITIQTLRNHLMVASFLGSGSLVVIFWFASIAIDPASGFNVPKVDFVDDQNDRTLIVAKSGVIIGLLMMAFFGMAQSMRTGVHVGFVVTLNVENIRTGDPTEVGCSLIRQMTRYFWLGLRGYYLCLPASLWLLGPSWLLGGTLFLLTLLCTIDYVNPALHITHRDIIKSFRKTKKEDGEAETEQELEMV